MRVTTELAAVVEERLSQRDQGIIGVVGLLGLASAAQLERLFWTDGHSDPATRERLRRRALHRLVELGVLTTLERRVGGVRAGSAGHIFVLDRLGRRLHEPERVGRLRTPEEPGLLFVRHALAVSDLYVWVREAAQTGRLELLGWESEPTCHRPFSGPLGARLILKPDAYLRLGIGAYEDRYFVELDTGTHRRGAVARKLDIYLAYYRSGREQAAHKVFPRVLWVATTGQRAEQLSGWTRALHPEARRLFAITTTGGFADFFTDEASS
jgi:hypothetical protein